MEGEREFTNVVRVPDDVSDGLFHILSGFTDEDRNSVANYFSELRSFKRAGFKIEIAAPIVAIHQAEAMLTNADYSIFVSMDFDLFDEDRLELMKDYPEDQIVSACLYVSLHDEFIEVAKLIDVGIHPQVLSGLLYGYKIQNIIGFLDQ